MTTTLRRVACVAAASAAIGCALTAPAVAAPPAAPVMPAPTGPHQVGKLDLHLVDRDRVDPWSKHPRELMVSVYYPARDVGRFPVAPYLSRRMADAVGDPILTQGELGLPSGALDWNAIRTHAHVGAPVEQHRGGYPVVVYSTYHLRPRTYATADAEDLASRGYVVVTMDSTNEAMGVEFPGGRVQLSRLQPLGPYPLDGRLMTRVRVADSRFVLDRLAHPPAALRGALDLRHVGMWGTVGGAVAGLQTAYEDPRVDAVAALNDEIGTPKLDYAPVVHHGVHTPFLLMSNTEDPDNHRNSPGWRAFWPKLTGWKLNVQLDGAYNHAFGDYLWVARQVPGMTPANARSIYGTVDPARALAAQRAFLAAFFDRTLRGQDHSILHGPPYPGVTYVR